MKKLLKTKVTTSIFEVMETMFYFTMEEKENTGEGLSDLFDMQTLRACRVTFSGEYSGSISLLIPRSVLVTMTQNFMGEDNDDPPEELTDGTLKEALNMIAGSSLTKMNEESYMGLGIPEMADAGSVAWDAESAVFNTGQGLIGACVEVTA